MPLSLHFPKLHFKNIPESEDFYNIVDEEATIMQAEQPAATTAAMASIQGQDREMDVELLDLHTRLAHQFWKGLYNFDEHKRLQKEIIVELRQQYCNIQ